MSYTAPLKDMLFVMNELAALNAISQMPGCEDATPDTAEAVLEENAKFCTEVLAPLNWTGDQQPSIWREGEVSTTPGFKACPSCSARRAPRWSMQRICRLPCARY
jgi:butyryl-CoA dehydrogenase